MSMLGLKEAASVAGVSRDTLRRAIQRGELPALLATGKTGPQFEVDQADVEVWAQKRATAYPQCRKMSKRRKLSKRSLRKVSRASRVRLSEVS